MEGMKSQQELADKEYVISKVTPSQSTCCWYGKTCRDGCDKFKDGKCTGIIHPTYPPKLADCPFANKACPQLDGWSEVTAGDPETGSGEATLAYQRPITKDEALKLSAPWNTYVRKVRALFGKDPQIKIVYDESTMRLVLYVDDPAKCEALKQLLPRKKEFGNVILDIAVMPSTATGYSSTEGLLRTAFKDNPVFFDADTVNPDGCSNPFTYISFANETVQLWNDNLSDLHGITTTLYQDIAKEVLELPGVYCCTQEGQNVIR